MAITPEVPGQINPPNTLTGEAVGVVATPNTLTGEAVGVVAAPNTLVGEAVGTVSAPNTLTANAAGSVSAPNTLVGEAVGSVSAPNTLTANAAGSVSAPNTLTGKAVGSVSAPNTLVGVTPAAFPRTLTPLVDMNFAAKSYAQSGTSVAFDDLFTYSRASSATFTNRVAKATGGYDYFLDTDYVGDVENLVKYSEQFDNAAWSKKVDATIVDSDILNPIGGRSVKQLTFGTSGDSRIEQTIIGTNFTLHTFSAWVKADTNSTIQLEIGGGNGGLVTFNVTNQWQQLSVQTLSAGGNLYPQIENSTATIKSFYIWGAQLTESVKPLPYVKTLNAPVTQTFTETLRTEYDPATGEALGALIEGGSTNLYTNSESFNLWLKAGPPTITTNATLAPDGTTSMDKLTNSSVTEYVYVDVALSLASTYTISVYIKNIDSTRSLIRFYDTTGATNEGTFSIAWSGGIPSVSALSGSAINPVLEDVGNGVYRASITVTSDATNTNHRTMFYPDNLVGTGSVYIWGAQLEALPFASSYIRTEGAAVSRSADSLSVGAENISAANTDFTISTDFSVNALNTGYPGVFNVVGETSRFASFAASDNKLSVKVGSTVITSVALTFPLNIKYSITANGEFTTAYIDNNQIGQGARTLTSGVKTSIDLGRQSTAYLYGHISKFATYDKALTAQEITLL